MSTRLLTFSKIHTAHTQSRGHCEARAWPPTTHPSKPISSPHTEFSTTKQHSHKHPNLRKGVQGDSKTPPSMRASHPAKIISLNLNNHSISTHQRANPTPNSIALPNHKSTAHIWSTQNQHQHKTKQPTQSKSFLKHHNPPTHSTNHIQTNQANNTQTNTNNPTTSIKNQLQPTEPVEIVAEQSVTADLIPRLVGSNPVPSNIFPNLNFSRTTSPTH